MMTGSVITGKRRRRLNRVGTGPRNVEGDRVHPAAPFAALIASRRLVWVASTTPSSRSSVVFTISTSGVTVPTVSARIVTQVRVVNITADCRHVVDRAGQRRLHLESNRHALTGLEQTDVTDHRAGHLGERNRPLDGQQAIDIPAHVSQPGPVQGGRIPEASPQRQRRIHQYRLARFGSSVAPVAERREIQRHITTGVVLQS